MKSTLFAHTAAFLLIAAGCSSTAPSNPTGTGGSNQTGTGGQTTGTGGNGTGTGGASTGGTTGTGGQSTGTGGNATGGVNGTGGNATGGVNGTGGTNTGGGGGHATGTGGTAGSGSGGAAGSAATGGTAGSAGLPSITSTMFGNFDDSFMITPCQGQGSGYDCPNLPTGVTSCPTANWSYGGVTTTEPTGNSYNEVFTVSGGDPSKVYDVTVHVLGQAEGRTYTGGQRALTTNVDPTAATNNLLYTGGQPGTTRVDYNVFQLTITAPSGATPIAGSPPTYFAFNAVDSTHEGNHYNYGVDETFTMKVKSGYTITLWSHDSNCIAIKNCGPGGPYNYANAAACEANARTTPSSVTLPATFRGTTITNPTKFQTQFLNFKVMSIVAE